MDVTIVGVALPGITTSFAETPASTLAWVFTAYNVTFAALLLLGGKLSDRFGPKRTFLCGLAVFTVASLMAALAPNAAVLIAARACKAAGSALIYPASIALLLRQFPPTRRSLGIGVLGGVSGLGGVIAPTLGSLLVQLANWRAVFFINLPFTLAALLLGAAVLEGSVPTNLNRRFDPVGVPLGAVAIGLLVFGIVQTDPWGLTDPRTTASFAAAIVSLIAFLYRSTHHPAPLLDLDLFRIRSFAVGTLVQVTATAPMFGWLVLMPTYFERVWHWAPLQAGCAVAPMPIVAAALSPLAGRLADQIGHRLLVATGCAIGATGTLWWAVFAGPSPHYLTDMLPGMVLTGLVGAAGVSTTTAAALSHIPSRFYSMAAAARFTMLQLGLGVGVAIAFAIIDNGDNTTPGPYKTMWIVATTAALLGAFLMATLYPTSRARLRAANPPQDATSED